MKRGIAIALSAALLAVGQMSWAEQVEQEITLKDNSTVIVFGDGEMAMRDSKGRPYSMKEGHPMQTKDGKTISMGKDNAARKSKLEQDREDMYRGA